ncbi:MAG TPA: hypothetical protein VMM60_08510, partial [Ilumatobacter sp.]|nr:hypothetical protein [Ilumatobacter sp.]
GGWQLHLEPDRTVTVTQPNGQIHATATPDMNRQTTRVRAITNDGGRNGLGTVETSTAPPIDQTAQPTEPEEISRAGPTRTPPQHRSTEQPHTKHEQMNLLAS